VARGGTGAKVKSVLALLGLLAIPVTYGLVTGWNPLPGWLDRLNALHALSQPAPAWTVRVDDQPTAAVVSGGTVVVFEPDLVDGRDAGSGKQLWKAAADWTAVAGSADSGGLVILAGKRGAGFQALNATSGQTAWSDPQAQGAWAFADLVVSIDCPSKSACTLTGRRPSDGAARWHAHLDGDGHAFSGANGLRNALIELGAADTRNVPPQPAPPLLGLPIDDQITVYSTSSGHLLSRYASSPTERIELAGTRVLVVTAKPRGEGCAYSVVARDPGSGRRLWQRDGLDLHTATGIGCDQRKDPTGGGGVVAGTADGRDGLFDLGTGTAAYRLASGDKLLGTDGTVAVVRAADKKRVRGIRRRDGTTLWTRSIDRHVQVSVAPGLVVFDDPDNGRLTALAMDSGQIRIDAKSYASVLGYANDGVVIHTGRNIGLLRFGSIA
jgi:outer membrane protein assembly factor BamB